MKPGWKTTEFWMTIVTTLLALAVTFGVITPQDSDELQVALSKCIGAAVVFVTSAYTIVMYIRSRLTLKALEKASEEDKNNIIPLAIIAMAIWGLGGAVQAQTQWRPNIPAPAGWTKCQCGIIHEATAK